MTKKGSSLLLLHLLLVFYSVSGILSKCAGTSEPFSMTFFLFYLAVLVILGIYAIGWQQVLKRMPLTSAFANKSITVVWGLIWGILFFGEEITPGKLVAAALIIAGTILFALSDSDDAHAEEGAAHE